jgi:hypothetical protein
MALKALNTQAPRIVDVRFGWPSIAIYPSTNHAVELNQGVVPGGDVAPGALGGPLDAGTQDDGDDGVDMRYRCEANGGWTCGGCNIAGFPIPEPLCLIGIVLGICFVISLIVGALLEWICKTEWIRDPGVRRRCSKKKCKKWCLCCNKWFCWFEIFIQWIMQQICGWVEVIQWLVFAACVVLGLIIVFA